MRAGKRFLTLLLSILFVGSSVISTRAENGVSDGTVDFVLVLDCSGSMNKNDKDRLTARASKQFIEMLPAYANTRIGIVVFGTDYGSDSYSLAGVNDKSSHRVKIAQPLDSIHGGDISRTLKIIDQEIANTEPQSLSPVGYALKAAAEMLENGDATRDNAAIILLSDGQVEGQSDGYNGGRDYSSIDEAISTVQAGNWPIYCMELNYAGNNRPDGSALGRIACHQMREVIPQKTGTDPIELKSAKEAEQVFHEIFARFFHTSPETVDVTLDEEGTANHKVVIPEMTAEESIILSGDVSHTSKVTFVAPGGDRYSFSKGDQKNTDDLYVNYSDEEGLFKFYVPAPGEWTVETLGDGKTEITSTAISVKETSFVLSSSEKSGELDSGTVISFKAFFSYKDKNYKLEDFCRKTPAYLVVNDERFSMAGNGDGYAADYRFDKKGSYKVYAVVEEESFRNGHRQTGEYHFTVGNEPLSSGADIGEITAGVGGQASPVDLKEAFRNPDGDHISYAVDYDHTVNISHEVTDDEHLIMTAATRKGVYEITVTADEGSGKEPVTQTFSLNCINKPVRVKPGFEEVSLEMQSDGKNGENSVTLRWQDYFEDPDGIPPRLAVLEAEGMDENEALHYEHVPDGVIFTADRDGSAEYTLTAVDASDLTEAASITVRIKATSEASVAAARRKTVLMIVIPVLIILLGLTAYTFLGRKIYGTWDLYTGSDEREGCKLATYSKSCRKPKCRLNQVVMDLELSGDFGEIVLNAGNNLNKTVILTGIGADDEVTGGGVSGKDKKLIFPAGRRTEAEIICKSGDSITLDNM